MGQHRLDHDGAVAEGQGKIDRQALIRCPLVFGSNSYGYVIPAIILVIRQMVRDPLRSLCDHKERAV